MSELSDVVELTYIVQLVQSGKAGDYQSCETLPSAKKAAKSLRKEVGPGKKILIVECRRTVIYDSDTALDLI